MDQSTNTGGLRAFHEVRTRGMQLSRQLYMSIAMVSQGSGQAYIHAENRRIHCLGGGL